jgi:type II secretory pathway component PulK
MKLSSQKGFGLIIALAAILVMGVLGTDLLREMSQSVRLVGGGRDRFKAYMLARGGVEWVRATPLKPVTTTESTDVGGDFWGFWSRIRSREFGGGNISVKVIDEAARLNVNELLDHFGDATKPILDSLFTSVGLSGTDRDAIFLSALTPKDSLTPTLTQSGVQPPPRRTPFLTVGEMRKLVSSPVSWDRLVRHVTVVSKGKVNVNRANQEVLASLVPIGGEIAARTIIRMRSFQPFESVAKVREELAKSGVAVPGESASRMTTSSETVTVWSVGEFSNQREAVAAVLNWNSNNWEIEFFRATGVLKNLEDVAEGF